MGACCQHIRVYDRAMLLTLHIIKIESGDYRAHVMEGAQHLGDYEATSIGEAILLISMQT